MRFVSFSLSQYLATKKSIVMPIAIIHRRIIDRLTVRYFNKIERRNTPGDFLTFDFKFIAYSPDGSKLPFIGNTVNFFSDSLDVNVNSTAVAVVFKAPHLI